MIDVAWCTSRGACYDHERLVELFPQPRTALEVLTLRDGPWESVSFLDRLWVLGQYVEEIKLRKLILEYVTEQFVKDKLNLLLTDPYKRRYIDGEIVDLVHYYHGLFNSWHDNRKTAILLLADTCNAAVVVALNSVYRYESDLDWMIAKLKEIL